MWVAGVLLSVLVNSTEAGEIFGNASLEYRYFFDDPTLPVQEQNDWSAAIEPEYVHEWDNGRQNISANLFYRYDQNDDQRTYGDIRELLWTVAREDWELRAGVGIVYWGVLEVFHLTDIVNQTAFVEDPDGESKLGQPMLNFSWVQEWGALDFYVLPWFRDRTYPGEVGRLRTIPRVDEDNPVFSSSEGNNTISYAMRWSDTIDEWDMGVYYFNGTGRDPRLVPGMSSSGEILLIPHYDQIQQVGLDVQGTFDAWLWKLETIYRSGQPPESYVSAAGGLEYTFFGVAESDVDVGIVLEYIWDQRGINDTTPFYDNVFMGTRIMANDVASSELLAGYIWSVDNHSYSLFLQGSRRFGNDWKLAVEARSYRNLAPGDPGYGFRNDTYIQLETFYYY
jgi:hypothetical protein